MLNFARVRSKEITLAQLCEGLTATDLRRLTNEMVDTLLGLIGDSTDADVTYVPNDPTAQDDAAATPEEVQLAWTLGHVIVHTTASAEESAALAAELARDVTFHGRSRSEAPWRTVTSLAQCRARLEESRRMRHASLEMWPDQPYLDNTYQAWTDGPHINAVERFVRGLSHDDSHLDHIREIVRQAKDARAT